MHIFPSRYEPTYLEILRDKLKLETAMAEAIEISRPPRRIGDFEYNRCIRVDFIGIASTTLFDIGARVAREPLYHELRSLLSNVKSLNEQGYFLKLRFLLEYPFSISAYTRIQAEYAERRSSINHTGFLRDFRLTQQVDDKVFTGSEYVTLQKNMLRHMQELYRDLDETGLWNDSRRTLNSFIIRFTPVQPGMCCLFINNTAFFDMYLLAKEHRHETRCKPLGPVIQLDKADGIQFAAFEDHFRYLWDLDITMDCDDATNYSRDVEDSLADIKAPHLIKFDAKGKRLKSKIEESQNIVVSNLEMGTWQAGINRRMNRLCADLSPAPSSEAIFIACSWQSTAGKYNPNSEASELFGFLHENLAEQGLTPITKINILEATLSSSLNTVLYSTLKDSTIGIVLLTGDIRGSRANSDQQSETSEAEAGFYSKPNVYHELGYMMSHLPADRIMILAEKGVTIPTNIQDVTRLDFNKGKLCLEYLEIILHLRKITQIDDSHVLSVLNAFETKLSENLKRNVISQTEYTDGTLFIEKNRKRLQSPRISF